MGRHWTRQYEHAWRDACEAVATQLLNTAVAEAGDPPFWHAEVVAHERRRAGIAGGTAPPAIVGATLSTLLRIGVPYGRINYDALGVSDAVGIAP